VELIVIGGGREAVPLLDTMRELLGRVGLIVEAHVVAMPADVAAIPRGSAAARVQVDLRAADEVVIVTEGRRPGATQRTIRRDPSPSLAREELAQAIQSAVESQLFSDPETRSLAAGALASGEPPAPEPPPSAQPAPPPAPEPAPPPSPAPSSILAREAPSAPPSSSSFGLDVTTLAGGGWLASASGAVVTIGGDVTLASRRGWRPSLSLAGRAVLPFDATADSVACHASAFDGRLLAGLELARGSWFSLVAGGGGGIDVMWADPRSAVLAPSVLRSSSTRVDAIVSVYTAARISLGPSVALTVMLLGDVDPAPSRYIVQQGSTSDTVLAPWNARPTVLAGFTFTALGPPAFAERTVP
jgi:hypothetical protein